MLNQYCKQERRRSILSRLLRSERGVTVVEFALILPVLVFLFIGLAEFSEAFMVSRKLSNAASTVSDLVSQEPTVDSLSLNDILNVADHIVAPYPAAPMSMTILSVAADDDNNITVEWSHPSGSYSNGESYSGLPQNTMLEPNTSLIVVEASYSFTPSVTRFLGAFQISESAYFRPRMGQTVKMD